MDAAARFPPLAGSYPRENLEARETHLQMCVTSLSFDGIEFMDELMPHFRLYFVGSQSS